MPSFSGMAVHNSLLRASQELIKIANIPWYNPVVPDERAPFPLIGAVAQGE